MATVHRQSSASSLGNYVRQTDREPELENRPLDFCNTFWGLSDPGVEVLFARMNYAAKTIEDLRAFWQERAMIEDEYGKRLVKLSKSALGKDEIGELRASLETLRVETERQAGQHLQLSIDIRKDLEIPTVEFAEKQAHHKKTFQTNVERTFKTKQAQETYISTAKQCCEQDYHRVNMYTARQTLVQGEELEHIMFKLDRAQSVLQTNERDYANYIKVLANTFQNWDVEWKNFCDQCQDLEEERIEFVKDNVWAYVNAVSTVCIAEDASCEKIRLALEQLEVENDLQLFVLQCGTGSDIPEPPPFTNHIIADVNTPKPATRPADFARSSTRQSNMDAEKGAEKEKRAAQQKLQWEQAQAIVRKWQLVQQQVSFRSEFRIQPVHSAIVAQLGGLERGNKPKTSVEFNVPPGVAAAGNYDGSGHGGREGNASALSTSPIDPQFISDFANQNFSDRTVSQYQTLASSPSMPARTLNQGPGSGPGPV